VCPTTLAVVVGSGILGLAAENPTTKAYLVPLHEIWGPMLAPIKRSMVIVRSISVTPSYRGILS
jgi:hypothetical protein